MAKYKLTRTIRTTAEVELRLSEDEPKGVVGHLLAILTGDLLELLGIKPRLKRTRTAEATEVIEAEGAAEEITTMILPNEPVETQLRETIHTDLAKSASDHERKTLETGSSDEVKEAPAASPGERLDADQALARKVRELRDAGWQVDLPEAQDELPPKPLAEPQRNALKRLLKSSELSRAERLIASLYYFDTQSIEEISTALDLSEARVRQMLASILDRLDSQP